MTLPSKTSQQLNHKNKCTGTEREQNGKPNRTLNLTGKTWTITSDKGKEV